MGNVCGSSSSKTDKEKINKTKSIRVEVTKNPNKFKKRNSSVGRLNGQMKIFEEIGDNNLSFLPNEQGKNTVSFVLYGEDVSKVRQTFLVELNNIKDLTLKLTQNQLLLLTEDNNDLLKILRNKNIDPRNLFGDKDNQSNNGSILSMSIRNNVIPNDVENNKQTGELPDFLKLKYNKMVQKSFLNSNQDDGKFLNTSFLQEGEYEKEVDDFLRRQNVLNSKNVKINCWTPNEHELIYIPESEKLFNIEGDQIWKNLERLASSTNTHYDKKFKNISPNKVFNSSQYLIEDLDKRHFKFETFFASLIGVINYDTTFNTSLIRRIIYPQHNGIPIPSQKGIYIVKLHINGCRRAIVIQDIHDTSMTIHHEKYPSILQTALDKIYLKKKNAKITNVIFRMTNWIPETLLVVDIGDALASFDKLQENFKNGYLMIFFDDPHTGAIKPILGLEYDKNTNNGKRCIKTTSNGYNNEKFIFEDWEVLYSSGRIENLFINWNPTIYSYRKQLHLEVPVKFQVKNSAFYNPKFRFSRYGQVILTISPHKDQSESRLVLEKHKNINNINYKIKYYLYHFYNNRMSVLETPLKEMEILESEDEILADIIVFDKNTNYENYILVFELIPENKKDYNNLSLDAKEVLSLFLYSFAEFDIVEIPFKKIDCYSKKMIHFPGLNLSNQSDDADLVFPLFKFHINFFGFYEIRIEGNPNLFYGINIYKYQNHVSSIKQRKYIKNSPFKNKGVCSLSFKLDIGDYIVQIKVSNNDLDEDEDNYIENKEVIKKHDIDVLFISYSENLVKEFEKHLPPKNLFTISELKSKFTVSACSEGQNLKIHKKLKGNWNHLNNHGTARAKADCYQKFMKNPGFIIHPSEITDCKFILQANKPMNNNKIPYLAISVIKILKDFKFKLILEENYLLGYKYQSEELTIKPNIFGYLILCYNLSKEWEGSFEFTVLSDKKLKSIKDNNKGILKLHYEKQFKGFIRENSGGHLNVPNFLFNSAFILTIDPNNNKETEIFIELILNSKDIPCSLYFYNNIPKMSLLDFNENELENAEYNPAFLYEINSLYKKLKPGHYFIIPSTLHPVKSNISFKLNISSNHKFKLNQVPYINFEQNYVIDIDMCKEHIIKFNLLKSTKVLLTVLPNLTDIEAQIFINNNSLDMSIYEKKIFIKNNFFHKVFVLDNVNSVYSITSFFNKMTPFKIELFSSVANAIIFQT